MKSFPNNYVVTRCYFISECKPLDSIVPIKYSIVHYFLQMNDVPHFKDTTVEVMVTKQQEII